ncbi:hypothetical protein FIBSPDRAFT_860019 [Athelia psychrophila]|uniref:Uncharacterized protein n=1 Tax=Athelia psychrophila TaxID=1759441 RepID=A0A166KPG1_9AGAM|nr:hypothetical protein FIBSPDRAFT_860019 [Fibularhizoctonia sp. CBS 109695]
MSSSLSGSDDEDSPETFSLEQSKLDAISKNGALRKAEAAEKEKRKEKNRQKDRKLKERALLSGKAKGLEVNDVQDRMERAMRDAGAEEDESGAEGQDGDEEMEDSENFSDESDDEDMSNVEEDSSDEDSAEPGFPSSTSGNPHHLPEHLFTTAFTPTTPSKIPASSSRKVALSKKRKRQTPGTKDTLVGTRVVRRLTDSSHPHSDSQIGTKSMPSSKATRFVNRSLALKGNKARTKGWERRPANIGVLKPQGGPAVGFVRG